MSGAPLASLPDRTFKVAVFPLPGRRPAADPAAQQFLAYTIWYNPTWPGCCEHVVTAPSGFIAKQRAIAQHRAVCLRLGKMPTDEAPPRPGGQHAGG